MGCPSQWEWGGSVGWLDQICIWKISDWSVEKRLNDVSSEGKGQL